MTIPFVLITAARNEEAFISRTIQSVVSQTMRPQRWVIVSDGSTDATDQIVSHWAEAHPFISLVRMAHDRPRSFAAQVEAIASGVEEVHCAEYEYIGNVDADVSFQKGYFQRLFDRFAANPRLGLAGGVVHEVDGSVIGSIGDEPLMSVPHATQMFRRACFESIGGYRALPHGGPDTVAEVMARMKGWEVEAFPDLVVQHHRQTGGANGILVGRFRQGMMDFCLGYDPLFEVVKCARRVRERPFLLGAVMRLAAFVLSYSLVRSREVPDEFVAYLRGEQRQRLRQLLLHRRS